MLLRTSPWELMATSGPPSTVRIVIDGRWVTVPKGTTVYQAARTAGIDIPIFCYHDRMPPLGACRMCLVQVEKMAKLQTSCTLVATDGMVVDTTSAAVKTGQEAMLEFLLINHPLDCPICDKGGECPLQDQTFTFGPGRSRFVEAKRDFAKPVSLGPVLTLDRERCILCWRCVRFGEIIAGDDALKGFERGFTSEINTPYTLPVESKFIGNTIAICPVGALTSTTYRFRSRPWNNQAVASTCTHCGLGCAVWLDVRDNEITRTRARESSAVNDIWLCDLGFFGHDYVKATDRLTSPLVRRDGRLEEATWDDALDLIAERLGASRQRGEGRVAFLGGRRLSNEDAFVGARLFRQVVGTPHLDHRVDAPPRSASLQVSWGLRASIEEIAHGDVFVLVGCDLTEEYPVLWLRIKQAIDRGARLIVVNPQRLEVRRHAAVEMRPAADSFTESIVALPAHPAAREILIPGRRSHVFLGKLALDGPQGWTVLQAAVDLSARLGGHLHVMRGRGNDVGAQRFGLAPGERGWTAPQILLRAASGEFDVLYVAGSDPATAVTDRAAWDAARRGTGFLVVHEAFLSQTAQEADVILPVLVLPEKDGTVTNLEGRTLPLRAATSGPGQARSDLEIFSLLAARLGTIFTYGTAEEVLDNMRDAVPDVAHGVLSAIPPVRVPAAAPEGRPTAVPATQQDGRAASASGNGRLTILIAERLFTQGGMKGRCPGISALAGPPHCLLHPVDATRLGIADGALVRLANASGSIALVARLSEDTLRGQVVVPRGFDGVPVHALVRWPSSVAEVEVRPL